GENVAHLLQEDAIAKVIGPVRGMQPVVDVGWDRTWFLPYPLGEHRRDPLPVRGAEEVLPVKGTRLHVVRRVLPGASGGKQARVLRGVRPSMTRFIGGSVRFRRRGSRLHVC